MTGAKANPGSAKSRLKIEAEKAIENWDESRHPVPKRNVITIGKKDPTPPADRGNITASVELYDE